MSNNRTEIVIVGAGIIGMTLALLLCRSGFHCVVVEKNSGIITGSDVDDPRVLALTMAAWRIFRELRVWENMDAESYTSFTRMHVWEEAGNSELEFDCAEVCSPALGFIVHQQTLITTLHKRIQEEHNCTVLTGISAETIHRQNDSMEIHFDNNSSISADLIVAADGSRSKLRELAGIPVSTHDYHQSAITCVVHTALNHEQIARQKFLKTGPLAFLPMFNRGQSCIVWTSETSMAEKLIQLDSPGFLQALQHDFGYELGEILSTGKRMLFPLYRSHAKNYCIDGLVLVGDAAHSVHPLAGQGANMGILDSACLAQIISEARHSDRKIGTKLVLRKYERWRKTENQTLMYALDAIHYIYANKQSPMPELRNIGVNLFNTTKVIKNLVMKHASGISGDLPHIAKT